MLKPVAAVFVVPLYPTLMPVKHIEEAELNGSQDAEKYVLELVRRLQAQAHYKKLLWRMIDQGKLTEHELERKKRFRSVGL